MTEFNPNITQRIVRRVRRRVVKDWRSRMKDYSAIALMICTALPGSMIAAWVAMPKAWTDSIPKEIFPWLAGVFVLVSLSGTIGKVLIQGPIPPDTDDGNDQGEQKP